MNKLEKNIINSFRIAKSDIIKLQQEMIELTQMHESLLKVVAGMKSKNAVLEERVKNLREKIKAKKTSLKTKTVVKKVKKAPKIKRKK